jgi:hypothetical protein
VQKVILTPDVEDIYDPQEEWVYPKKINNSFDGLIAEEFGDIGKPVTCKRCGKEFIRKYEGQVFCSRKCVSQYKNRMNKMKEIYGKEFEDWLDDGIDYTYSPEKF